MLRFVRAVFCYEPRIILRYLGVGAHYSSAIPGLLDPALHLDCTHQERSTSEKRAADYHGGRPNSPCAH
ncbi:hypothetical protein D4R08_09045 [Corynebacterium xerosis]|nr:hypothetical protein D4R08_09045 [Corynebacterium xerosis]